VAEILKEFEAQVDSITLIPSDGGRFEVTVNDRMVYSKLRNRRHADRGEVVCLMRKFLLEVN
jgi:selenoprotein W-related protein